MQEREVQGKALRDCEALVMEKGELSLNDRKVYNFLYSTVRGMRPMKTRATSAYIAEKIGVSKATVANCLETLEELGYIRRKTKTVAPPLWRQGETPSSSREIFCLYDGYQGYA